MKRFAIRSAPASRSRHYSHSDWRCSPSDGGSPARTLLTDQRQTSVAAGASRDSAVHHHHQLKMSHPVTGLAATASAPPKRTRAKR